MTQRLILHIGHPKTGTTTLQKTLQASRPALINAGILHPDTGRHHNHKVLIPYLTRATPIAQKNESWPSKSVETSGKKWAEMIEATKASNPNTIILSSEGFSRDIEDREFTNLVSNLRSLTHEISTAIYLREPAALALSRAQQHVKRKPNFTLQKNNYYRSILERYRSSEMGPMNVRIFDRSILKNGDIVEDFFTQHFPHFDTGQLSRRKDANTSFSAEAMALIQGVNRNELSLPIQGARHAIEQADRELPGFSRPRMHDHIRHAIQARATDLDWIRNEFGLEFPNIDTQTMPRSEANRLCDALDRVEDMCVVDADRKAALWNAVCKDSRPMRRLLRRIFKMD